MVHHLKEQGIQLEKPSEIRAKIKTEDYNVKPAPDIQYDSNGSEEANEVEILFGESLYADKKINETIKKCEENRNVSIVMNNLGSLMYLRELIGKNKSHKNAKF